MANKTNWLFLKQIYHLIKFVQIRYDPEWDHMFVERIVREKQRPKIQFH